MKTFSAVALVFLLLGAYPLFAAASSLSMQHYPASQQGLAAPPHGVTGWLRPSLFTDASATPAFAKTPAKDEIPENFNIIEAWFIGIGIVVFIISRKRYKE